MEIQTEETLPKDQERACLVGRAWNPGNPGGPSPIWIHQMKVYDLSPHCLLYTSPSPRDRTRSRMPSSA